MEPRKNGGLGDAEGFGSLSGGQTLVVVKYNDLTVFFRQIQDSSENRIIRKLVLGGKG